MKTKTTIKLTQEGTMTVLHGALEKAKALGAAASVSVVVEDGGHMLAFGRSDDAELYSIAISTAKARSAALTRFPSGKKSPSGNERDDHHALAISLAAGPGSFGTIPVVCRFWSMAIASGPWPRAALRKTT
jgi:uncharacterized protein GlcG (DUF336 family)